MAIFTKHQLSSEPNGLPKDISGLYQHVIHSVPVGSVTDELWLYASNFTTTQAALVVEVTYNSVTRTMFGLYIPAVSNILVCAGAVFTSDSANSVDIKLTDG